MDICFLTNIDHLGRSTAWYENVVPFLQCKSTPIKGYYCCIRIIKGKRQNTLRAPQHLLFGVTGMIGFGDKNAVGIIYSAVLWSSKESSFSLTPIRRWRGNPRGWAPECPRFCKGPGVPWGPWEGWSPECPRLPRSPRGTQGRFFTRVPSQGSPFKRAPWQGQSRGQPGEVDHQRALSLPLLSLPSSTRATAL